MQQCGAGEKEAMLLAASQPQSWASWDCRDPVPPPLDKHSVLSQDGAREVKEQMWKGREDEKDPPPPPVKVLWTGSFVAAGFGSGTWLSTLDGCVETS